MTAPRGLKLNIELGGHRALNRGGRRRSCNIAKGARPLGQMILLG